MLRKPISKFQDLTGDTSFYRVHQIKITYLCGQISPTPTLVLHSFARIACMRDFEEYSRSNISYGNDYISLWDISVLPKDIQLFIEMLNLVEKFKDGEATYDEPYFSLMIVNDTGGESLGFEVLISDDDAEEFIALVVTAFSEADSLTNDLVEKWAFKTEPAKK